MLAVALVAALWWGAGTSGGEGQARGGRSEAGGPMARLRERARGSAAAGSAEPGRDERGAAASADGGGLPGAGEEAPSPATGDGGAGREALERWFARNAAAAEKNVDAFCDEAKQLKRPLPETDGRRARDASSFLTVRIDWEDNVRPPGLLHLPEPLRARLKSYGPLWPTDIRDDDLVGLDFSWMSELQQYDYWNLLAEGPLRDSRDADFYSAPIPNFVELQAWTKLRLARAMRVGDFEAASADIHQLVALLHSTGLLIADMVTVALLNLERAGLEAAAAAGMSVPAGLSYGADDMGHARHVARAGMYFFLPGVSEKVMRKALECSPQWRCSALMEGLGSHVTAGEEVGALLAGAPEAAHCGPELFDWVRRAHPRSPGQLLEAMGSEDSLENALTSPVPR